MRRVYGYSDVMYESQPPKPPSFASRMLTDRLKQGRQNRPNERKAELSWWRRLVRFLKAE